MRIRLLVIRLSQRKFTVSVAVLVVNGEGETLVLDHYIRPGATWGLPGGFVEPEEDPSRAIRRELMEETGIELDDLRLLEVRTIRKHIEILFTARSDGNAVVMSREVRALGWFRPDDLPENMNSRQKRLIREQLEGNESS